MSNAVASILRAATRTENEPLNILTFATHERFESCWGRLEHNFFMLNRPGMKKWNYEYASFPNNYSLIENDIPIDVEIDLVISQNRFAQYEIASNISNSLQVPLITLEHTLPHPDWTEFQTRALNRMTGDVNVFLSEYSRRQWFWENEYSIISPGIDSDIFSPAFYWPTKPIILSVVNDWVNRDAYCGFYLWKKITEDLPVHVLGDNPGLSRPAKNTAELLATYRQSRIFLNTSLVLTCPFTLLEAMACGCAVVSTATTIIPEVINNGVNGYCTNDPTQLRNHLVNLLDNPELCRKLGREARKTIEEKFSFDRMSKDWDNMFRKAVTECRKYVL